MKPVLRLADFEKSIKIGLNLRDCSCSRQEFYSGDTHRGYPDSPPIRYEESSEQNPRAQEPQGRTIRLLD
ncbi:hypothetical protein Tco_0801408 [Tanacetum coccineum]|uniref:Uncharacterized protein n=1 Tax=Tanacetum coccineum TaxID=301880 RepID=A0ABQ4ZVW0_9ASTR